MKQEKNSSSLNDLESLLEEQNEVGIEFSEGNEADSMPEKASNTLMSAASVSNKYLWNYNTLGYSFENQSWATNSEIYSTYNQTNEGFVMSGYLYNPKGSSNYASAIREGYLDDSGYATNEGHFYQLVVSSASTNDITLMLEKNVYVYIFNSDFNLIYRSSDDASSSGYLTRYYTTNKSMKDSDNTNKIISMELETGNYYIMFQKADGTITGNSHYAYYAGQPLPIVQSSTASNSSHYGTIKWNGSSISQSLVTQTITINAPDGYESEYALTNVVFSDLSKAFANNVYAKSINYYYIPPTSSSFKLLTNMGDFWGDKVDTTPTAGSIDGSYQTQFTVNWVTGISYVNAGCTAMTKMTITYFAPFGIIVG